MRASRSPAAADTADGAGRSRKVVPLVVSAFVLLFVLVYRRVLGVTQRPSWPPPSDAVTSAGAQAATEEFVARGDARPHDAALPFAWSTAATIEPLVGGRELLPEDLRRCRGRAVDGAHPDVRLARGRRREEDGRASRAEAGGGRRGPGDRGQLRLQAVRTGAGDVHEPRSGRRADRRQRRLPTRPRRPVPRRPAGGLAAGRGRASRSPQALRDRRRGRVDGRRGDRGPLRERRLSRRDGAGHRRRRPAGAGGVPDELPRPRRRRFRPDCPRSSRSRPSPARRPSRSRR